MTRGAAQGGYRPSLDVGRLGRRSLPQDRFQHHARANVAVNVVEQVGGDVTHRRFGIGLRAGAVIVKEVLRPCD